MVFGVSAVFFFGLLACAALVGDTFADVKLSDLGAARNVKSKEDYTYIATTDHLPARWMPLEAIRDAAFSHKSDVFSFGVRHIPPELFFPRCCFWPPSLFYAPTINVVF